jgi:hypothetical protein
VTPYTTTILRQIRMKQRDEAIGCRQCRHSVNPGLGPEQRITITSNL